MLKKCRFIVLFIFLSSCATSELWRVKSYDEKISGFYLDKENNHLIVSGQKYSYIFNINNEFKEILQTSRTIKFKPKFRYFELDPKNNISGEVTFSVLTEDLSKKELIQIKKLGFKKEALGYQNSDPNALSYSSIISGKSYMLEGDLPVATLEHNYIIDIKTPPGIIKTIGKIIATPATIAFDAFIISPIGLTIIFAQISLNS